MKKSEIVVGAVYTNGKGRFRLVLDTGPQYKLYDSQTETDCLCYRGAIVQKRDVKQEPKENSTRASFASWAKAAVSPVDLPEGVRSALMLSA